MVEARLLLATLLQRWGIRNVRADPPGTVSSISLRPDGPVEVVVERRGCPPIARLTIAAPAAGLVGSTSV